ncbi:hypothetical protein PR202_gb12808 [Eleusine coracana subsp. coracana]|uniref:Uncharacterized protein n=1 Tax=Eleusine coracana subsp. coracana TaxID=191504 RepID=A0AAV5EQZ5_ELECO|nr:hypothetical protein PR202_gb12808 [Eleusine coracana subsp. coracana]
MAWGLATSGVPFLWVVRPGSVHGVCEDEALSLLLPDEVKDEIRNRGKVVTWAPQKQVLAHSAIGAFWTHCGWNSMLESLCEGVPMIVQPCFADQMVTARYVTHQWRVGLEVGEVVERASVAKAVRKVMAGEDGAQTTRDRAHKIKVQLSSATTLAIDSLVEYMSSL